MDRYRMTEDVERVCMYEGSERVKENGDRETNGNEPTIPSFGMAPRGEKLGWGSPQASPEESGEFKESWGWDGVRVEVVVVVMGRGGGGGLVV